MSSSRRSLYWPTTENKVRISNQTTEKLYLIVAKFVNVNMIGKGFIPGFNLQDALPPVKGVTLNEEYVVHSGDLCGEESVRLIDKLPLADRNINSSKEESCQFGLD